MTAAGARGYQGAIIWAVSTFDVEDPFHVHQHDGTQRPMSATDIARAVRGREMGGEFELIVAAKLRPVVLLQDRPAGRIADYAALRMMRLEKFAPEEQQEIRDGNERSLFYLGHNKAKYGQDKEYAVALGSLHRVHRSALVGRPVGYLDESEFRTVCERLVRVSDLALHNLIVREAGELVRRLKS